MSPCAGLQSNAAGAVAVSEGLSEDMIDSLLLQHRLMDQWPTQQSIHAFVRDIIAAADCSHGSDGAAPLPLSDADILKVFHDLYWSGMIGSTVMSERVTIGRAIEAEVTRRLGRGSDGAVQAEPVLTAAIALMKAAESAQYRPYRESTIVPLREYTVLCEAATKASTPTPEASDLVLVPLKNGRAVDLGGKWTMPR